MKANYEVATHTINGFLLQVLHDGLKGISWDFPVKPNDAVSSKEIQEVLSVYEWAEDDIQYHGGWSWDRTDLLQCKNALNGLLLDGVDERVLYTLDFGSLNVAAVIDEYC